MTDKKLKIALDGPSGAGKSTIAKQLSERLGLPYMDTGAMYRAVGLKALKMGVDMKSDEALKTLAEDTDIALLYSDGAQRVILDGEDVTDFIRTPEVSMAASNVSRSKDVRLKLVEVQRATAEVAGAVLDGRDIGTFVLPNADYKFYLTASPEERAKRRTLELRSRGSDVSYEDVLREMIERDRQDSTRDFAPLKKADDAIEIDSTGKSVEDVLYSIMSFIAD